MSLGNYEFGNIDSNFVLPSIECHSSELHGDW